MRDLVFSSAAYVAGSLTIENWAGTPDGGTDDRIFITARPDATFLANVDFVGFNHGAVWRVETGELMPVPEPLESGGLVAMCLLGFVGWRTAGRRATGAR